jgi:hypothetical protein
LLSSHRIFTAAAAGMRVRSFLLAIGQASHYTAAIPHAGSRSAD